MTACTGGRPASTGSVSTRTSRAPRSARSMPTSRVTPTPKRIPEAAISNAASRTPSCVIEPSNILSLLLPARVYSVVNERGRFLVTVVDYTNAESIHKERLKDCPPAAQSECIGSDFSVARIGRPA